MHELKQYLGKIITLMSVIFGVVFTFWFAIVAIMLFGKLLVMMAALLGFACNG